MGVLAVVEEGGAATVRDLLRPVIDGFWWTEDVDQARRLLDRHDVGAVVASPPMLPDLAPAMRGGPPLPVALVVFGDDPSQRRAALAMGADEFVDAARGEALAHVVRAAVRIRSLEDRAQVAEARLLHANRLIGVGRLAAITAHEVGTPLQVARMQAQLVAAERPDDALVLRSCATIVEQIDVASGRMRAMLDFARLGERGPTHLNLAEAVHSAVDLLGPVVRRQGVQLTVEGSELLVKANRSQVQQVVFNLLTNALHALEGRGNVQVCVARVERSGRFYGSVSVTDDGPGVAEEVRGQVFDAFVTTKPAGRGTGLGLAVCRDIVEGHGGWIELHSVPGRTKVEAAFPVA